MLCINFALTFCNKHMCFKICHALFAASCWHRLVFCILMSDLMAVRIASILCKKNKNFVQVFVWCSRDSHIKGPFLYFSLIIFKFNWKFQSRWNEQAETCMRLVYKLGIDLSLLFISSYKFFGSFFFSCVIQPQSKILFWTPHGIQPLFECVSFI